MTTLVPSIPISSILLFAIFLGLVSGLELQQVAVPEYKVRGARASLSCMYDLQNATLYSLKWYKGDKQFYQYIPSLSKAKNTFNVDGVTVDVEASNQRKVVLQDVELHTSGTYRCEVITEGPLFHTKIGESNMTVIDLPESAPVLSGSKTSYQLGERVNVNCTSLSSKPAATLEWFINDNIVQQPGWLRRYKPHQDPDGLETAVLGLTFVASRGHFPDGELRLKCVARIATVYFQSQETSSIETGFLPRTQAEGHRHQDYYFFGGGHALCGNVAILVVSLAVLVCT